MNPTIYDTMTRENSAFLDTMEKAREAANKSIGMMSAIGQSIGGLSVPGIEASARGINDVMEQGRQFAAQARRTSPPISTLAKLRKDLQRTGVSGEDTGTKKPMQKSAPFDHFKTPDTDRLAKLGLFIGGAPQTPGLSEARRTATATEKISKGIDKLNVIFAGNKTKINFTPVYVE